jgi:uncharacterized protein YjdB/beta-N-acetylglucosaminidase
LKYKGELYQKWYKKVKNMMYENNIRKKALGMFAAGMISFSTLLTGFSGINNVQASIKTNLPKSYMSDNFPNSYKPYIDALKSAHPNWVFKAVYTGLDWNQAVTHESYDVNEGISLVPDSYDAVWKKDGQNYYKDGNFVIASKEAVKYMLDPRGHLNEKEVFQFQTLSYSSSMDSINSIEKVLYGTSMYNRSEYQRLGSMVNMGQTYSNIILQAAKKYNVSAIHIASRIKQETSGAITSNRSINGSTVVNGVVPYNYFNIGATPPNAITNGLTYAAGKGWKDPVSAINGGTDILRNSWIKWGQDTTYFQKFDVNNPYGNAVALYAYQYMANIIAPTNESYSTYNAYQKMGMLDSSLEFHVPVFENMSEYPTPYPGESEITYIDDNTRICAYDVAPYKLYIRSGPGTDYSIVAKLDEGNEMTRIAKSVNTQWDKVRLDNGIEGYVFRDYTKEVPKDVKVTGISLDKNNLELKIGDTYTLTSTITPNNATNKEVEWSSNNSDVATVENGKIVAKNKGEAKITVKSKDTGVSATCNVKVVKKVTEISISESAVNLNVGDESTLNYTIGPDDATNKEVEWISSNSDVVSVDNGKVIAKKTGTANITVKSKDTGISASCKITVTARVESIELQKNSYTVIKGKKLTINPVIKPEYATNKEYTILSDDENIVKIENNVIVGVNEGKTNITFTTKDQNKSVKAEINVINISDSDFITFDETLKVNEDNGYVSKIEPNTKTSSIFDKMEYNKDKFDVVIKNINGKVISDDDLIGTGTTISLVSKDSREEIQTFTVIIYGDVNGDGKIYATDYVKIKNHIMDVEKIKGACLEAADVNHDGKIYATDYVKIKNYIMGTGDISQ